MILKFPIETSKVPLLTLPRLSGDLTSSGDDGLIGRAPMDAPIFGASEGLRANTALRFRARREPAGVDFVRANRSVVLSIFPDPGRQPGCSSISVFWTGVSETLLMFVSSITSATLSSQFLDSGKEPSVLFSSSWRSIGRYIEEEEYKEVEREK